MNRLACHVASFLCGVSLCAFCVEHTPQQTNELMHAMLRSLLVCPRFDDHTGEVKSFPKSVPTQEEFFAGDDEWSADERRSAFDAYLRNMASSARTYGPVRGRVWVENPLSEAAVAQCWAMNYTNAIPLFFANVRGAYDPSRVPCFEALLQWCSTSDRVVALAGDIATNAIAFLPDERSRFFRAFCEELSVKEELRDSQNCQAWTNGVAVMYDSRRDPMGAVAVDQMLILCRPAYSNSFDRWESALEILSSTNSTKNCRRYFTVVTNRLDVYWRTETE